MKRTIAITLTALLLAFSLIGCGGRNDGNVSDTSNGTVNSSSGRYQDGLTGSNTQSGTEQNRTNNSTQNRSSQNDGFMNDMRDAASDIGDAVGEAGNAVGDAITGNNTASSTGMTGGR